MQAQRERAAKPTVKDESLGVVFPEVPKHIPVQSESREAVPSLSNLRALLSAAQVSPVSAPPTESLYPTLETYPSVKAAVVEQDSAIGGIPELETPVLEVYEKAVEAIKISYPSLEPMVASALPLPELGLGVPATPALSPNFYPGVEEFERLHQEAQAASSSSAPMQEPIKETQAEAAKEVKKREWDTIAAEWQERIKPKAQGVYAFAPQPLAKPMEPIKEYNQHLLVKLIAIGQINDKFSLIRHYTHGPEYLYDNCINPIGVDFSTKSVELEGGREIKVQVWDTAGQERYRTLVASYLRGTHGAAIFFDTADASTFKKALDMLQACSDGEVPELSKVIIGVVANPADRVVDSSYIQKVIEGCGLKYVEVSREGRNINEAFEGLVKEVIAKHDAAQAAKTNPAAPAATAAASVGKPKGFLGKFFG